jgi:large subunit ribosomal protein L10
MKIEQKKQIKADLHERFLKSKIVILTDYKGLDVAAFSSLRRKLKDENVEFKVAKNSLLIRASEATDVAVLKDQFKGPSGIALSYDDPVAPARILMDFARDNKKFEVKIGAMNGKLLDLTQIKSLSALPSREILLGQVLSAMNGVPTAMVRALNDVPGRMLNVLQAIKDQKEAA